MKNRLLPFLAIFVLWFLFSMPVFVQGKAAFPATYQTNFFPPWSTYKEFAGPVKNNAQPDIITQIYPWRYFSIQELKQGRIPFWNPYSFAGTPHLANYQSAALFPLNILFFLPFRFIDVWSLLVILQPLLAGIFTYIFVRKIGGSKLGSLLSSYSFMFCGFIVTWMGYATLGFAILPLPLALFAIESYVSKQRNIWLIILSLTFMFSFFAGHFQTSLYFAIVIFSYLIYYLIGAEEKQNYLECLLFSLFGLLLITPQVLPSIEFYAQSVRSNLFQKVEAIPLSYLPTLIAPDFYGNPVTRNDWFGHYAEWSSFAGAIPLMLAIFTIVFSRSKKLMFFVLLGVVSLLLALDTPILSLIVLLKIPVLSTSAASRIIVLFSFSVAVLAGFGLDSLYENIKKNNKKVLIWLLIIFIVLFIVGLTTFLPFLSTDKLLIARKNFVFPALVLIVFMALVALNMILRKKQYLYILLYAAVFMTGFEMFRFAAKWQSFERKDYVFKSVPTTDFYSKNKTDFRYLGDFTAENAVYYRLQSLNGYDPLYPQRYGEFIKSVGDGKVLNGDRSAVVFPKFGKYTSTAINFLGVKYFSHKKSDENAPWEFPFKSYPENQFPKIYEDNNYQVFENNFSFPRAFILSNLSVYNKDQEIVDYVFSHDIKKSAVVEEKIKDIFPGSTGDVDITEYLPNKVTIQANSDGNALLVLTDNFYPGWKAYVNGVSTPIYRTDYSFRGIVVPKGKSTVIFSYLPQSFLVGTYLFLIGILGMIVSIVFKKFQIK